jgi:hypothetical protein
MIISGLFDPRIALTQIDNDRPTSKYFLLGQYTTNPASPQHLPPLTGARKEADRLRPDRERYLAWAYPLLTISTEISTAGIVPLFSSQCRVFRSSGQPNPGPYSVAIPSR